VFVRRSWRLRLSLVLLAVSLAWLSVEGLSWFWLRLCPGSGPVGRWEFRATRPAPYQDADYFGAEFLDESMRCVRLGSPAGANYLVPGDFAGRFFHVQEGRRRTTDQPATARHRVLLFGGSAVFGQEVPDECTLASCLQRALNERSEPLYRVQNYGTPAMIARQETERLTQCTLAEGDVVVFYDGVNDVFYPVYNGNPEGYRIGDSSDGGVRKLSGVQATLYPLCFRLKDYSCAAALLFRGMDGPRPANLVDETTLSRHLDDAAAGYLDALTTARAYAESRGACFVHLLQPHLFSLPRHTAYERGVIRNELLALPGLDMAFRLGYPRLRQAAAKAAETGMCRCDLSDVLEERSEAEEFYLDFCHVNHAANERLAQTICECILSLQHDTSPKR
jgi:hypothetical protein